MFYFNNKFNAQVLSQESSISINDVSNFKGAYYLSTEDGIIKVSENLNNIIPVYDRDENIISIIENDFFRVLLTNKKILVYEEEEILFSFDVDKLLKGQDVSNPQLLLDEDEYLLKAGDVVVQQGTNHAWSNRGSEPCQIAFILIDAE